MMVRWWVEVECEKEMVGSRWREGTAPNTQIHTVTLPTLLCMDTVLVLPLGTDLPCWVPIMVAGLLPLPPKAHTGAKWLN